MANTGYQIQNGTDLINVFKPIAQGTMYSTPTGFLISDGKDLREIFAKNVLNTIDTDTGYMTNNIDLRNIFEAKTVGITVTGTGTYTISPLVGKTYKITFTGGTNAITMDSDISSLNIIAVGGGGGGGYGTSNVNGGGGGGGGFGYLSLAYVKNTIYNINVAASVGFASNGNNTTFTNASTGLGITATGGGMGDIEGRLLRGTQGTCTNNGGGTLTARTGGTGGVGLSSPNCNGGNSSGSITVLGVSYNYGGGGRSGDTYKGGTAGSGGTGGVNVLPLYTYYGESATSAGSGGGGASNRASTPGGNGGPGLVIVTFTYP